MKDGMSVILCCHNSVAKLPPTLEHLQKQQALSPDEWEVILVDNASSDGTLDFAKKIWTANAGPAVFRTVDAPIPGLANARIKGIAASNYKYLLFCDDDNWLNPNYVATALEIMRGNDRIGILGGYAMPEFEGDEPPYFWENQYHALAVGSQYKEEGDITETRSVVYGAGMVVNNAAYQELLSCYDFQFQTSGRTGKNMASSEDHELCLAMKLIGYRIFWSKKLRFKHYIPGSRTTLQYYRKLFLGFGTSYPFLIGYGLTDGNITNDYRYRALRNLKNIFKVYLRMLLKGYYFGNTANKYRNLNLLQSLQTNKGSLITTLNVKNQVRDRFLKSQLFLKSRQSNWNKHDDNN